MEVNQSPLLLKLDHFCRLKVAITAVVFSFPSVQKCVCVCVCVQVWCVCEMQILQNCCLPACFLIFKMLLMKESGAMCLLKDGFGVSILIHMLYSIRKKRIDQRISPSLKTDNTVIPS